MTYGGTASYAIHTKTLPAPPVVSIKTAPAAGSLAVSLSDVKAFLSYPIEDTGVDNEITALIQAAQAAVEYYCEITLLETTFVEARPDLDGVVTLLKRPFSSLTQIEYVDPDDAEEIVVSDTLYHVLPSSQYRGTVYLDEDKSWPDAARRADAYRIEYVAGWTAATLPADLKNALMQIVAKLDAPG